MDPNWLPFHPNPSKPIFRVPKGAVDAHCHVFGPANKFPFALDRKYTPCDASKEELFRLRDFLGFEKNVIVQASCHGTNNDALEDALISANNSARGVATVSGDITAATLRRLDSAGVRGVRFNFLRRLVHNPSKDTFKHIAKKIADLGWHVVVYVEASDLKDLIPFLETIPTDIIFDHMARPDVSKGLNGVDFSLFQKVMDNEKFWCKTSCAERLSLEGPETNYSDIIPFMQLLIKNYSDRVLWGTDWPHPNMRSHMPDDGFLVNLLEEIAPKAEQQKKLLVDNPNKLYWNY